jgi:DNA-directed RNA polymerase subunit RPC12/RpoP
MVICFGLIIFAILKNFTFEDYRESPTLTNTQVTFIWIFFVLGFLVALVFLLRGIRYKTPKYYTRVGVGVFITLFFMFIIFALLFRDYYLMKDKGISPEEMMAIMFSSVLTIIGSYIYLALKYPEYREMKYFKDAVKEEIRARREEEQQMRGWQAQRRRWQREQRLTVKPYNPRKQPKLKDRKAARAARAASRAQKASRASKAQRATQATQTPVVQVQQAQMLPADDITIFNCAKCARSLKISSPERPITIKCPYCEAIGVIKE